MSIETKRAYRFEFLKSEEWQTIRAECLATHGTRCHICEHDDFYNDVHHVVYPPRWSDTKPHHVVVLCRECHELAHYSKISTIRARWFEINRLRWLRHPRYADARQRLVEKFAEKSASLKFRSIQTDGCAKCGNLNVEHEHPVLGVMLCPTCDASFSEQLASTKCNDVWRFFKTCRIDLPPRINPQNPPKPKRAKVNIRPRDGCCARCGASTALELRGMFWKFPVKPYMIKPLCGLCSMETIKYQPMPMCGRTYECLVMDMKCLFLLRKALPPPRKDLQDNP